MTAATRNQVGSALIKWLNQEVEPPREVPLSDFERIQYELRPCDVLLIEGRTRISQIIKRITQSNWSHAALFIGRLHDIEDKQLREKVRQHFNGEPDTQLIIESLLGDGTTIAPLDKYRHEHIRICRPKGISRQDSQRVIGSVINRLGASYDLRQIIDLARFLLPWNIVPRRWMSSLFNHNAGVSTKESCPSLLAEAFSAVNFPILPVFQRDNANELEVIQRNPKLFTPSDFDYSPFFEIIKYPIFEFANPAIYRKLPWKDGIYSDDEGKFYARTSPTPETPPAPLEPEAAVKKNTDTVQEKTEAQAKGKKKRGPTSEFFD